MPATDVRSRVRQGLGIHRCSAHHTHTWAGSGQIAARAAHVPTYMPACLGHAQVTVGLRCPRASASSDHCAGCSTLRRADHRAVRTATVLGGNTSRGLWQTPAASLTCQQQQRHQRPGDRSGTHDCRWQHVECRAAADGGAKGKHVWAKSNVKAGHSAALTAGLTATHLTALLKSVKPFAIAEHDLTCQGRLRFQD